MAVLPRAGSNATLPTGDSAVGTPAFAESEEFLGLAFAFCRR